MPTLSPERNLLLALLALQNGFISRNQLVAAFGSWLVGKDRSIGDILLEQQALDAATSQLLDALVERHLVLHGGDAQQSLAQLSSIEPSIKQVLLDLNDNDLNTCLSHSHTHVQDKTDDPFATLAHAENQESLERFVIIRPHLKGGLGKVSVAFDKQLRREVALKEILPEHASVQSARSRFIREAEITGGLEHPSIVPVYGLGVYSDGRPYYAMKFVKGRSLQTALAEFHKHNPVLYASVFQGVEFRQLLRRLLDVCDAIQYAHDRGVLHRDLKPGNIMLGKYGETLVIDWGLAKSKGQSESRDSLSSENPLTQPPPSRDQLDETKPGAAIGTPNYMSPEQAAGQIDELGPATDVYSLGATLFHIITGQPAFRGIEPEAIISQVLKGEFTPPRKLHSQIPKALEAICLKAMHISPRQRYASPSDLAADLEHWLADEPVSVVSDPISDRLARIGRKHRGVVATILAAAILLAIGSSVAAFWFNQQRQLYAELAIEKALLALSEQREKENAQSAEADASRNASNARQSVRFLQEFFMTTDPLGLLASGKAIDPRKSSDQTMKELLELGLERVNADPELSRPTPVRAVMLETIGNLRMSLGLYDKTESILLEALRIREDDTAQDAEALSSSLLDLGILYEYTGRYEKAESYCRQSLDLQRSLLKDDDLRIASTSLVLAMSIAYRVNTPIPKERLLEAERLIQDVVRIRESKLGKKHRDVGVAQIALGAVVYANDPQRAIEEYPALTESIEGELSFLVRDILIAGAFEKTGGYETGIKMRRNILSRLKSLLGESHPFYLLGLGELAGTLRKAGNEKEGEAMIRVTLDLARKSQFHWHPAFVEGLIQLALHIRNRGELVEAKALFAEALTVAEGIEAQSLIEQCRAELARF